MYKDSCCAQATMQSVNAFSRETLAASASCQAGRNKVYQKKGKKELLDIFSYFSPCFLGKGRARPTAEQGVLCRRFPLPHFGGWSSECALSIRFSAAKPHNYKY